MFVFIGVRQEAEVSDFDQALGQDMEQEASYELMGIKGHFFDFIVSLPIAVGKRDATVIDCDDTIV